MPLSVEGKANRVLRSAVESDHLADHRHRLLNRRMSDHQRQRFTEWEWIVPGKTTASETDVMCVTAPGLHLVSVEDVAL